MIILLEGPPRAGKSYHAVKDHILPALAAGRSVYARLNGLDHAKIAAHLELPESRVRELLHVVALEDVTALFTCFGDDPPRFEVPADSLVVIDEVQDSYPSSRQALPAHQEAFFAKHGHIGLDVVIMTQAVGRLHSAIRQRIERKSVVTKMTALGKEDGYSVRFFSVADQMGKFEKISHERGEYDPAIYPLYKGYQPEAKNVGAYTAGSKTVWQVIKGPAIAISLLMVLGIVGLVYFFRGGGVVAETPAPAPVARPTVSPTTEQRPLPMAAPAPQKAVSPEVALVQALNAAGRPRYAGSMGDLHLLEWRATGGRVIDRLTSDQMIELGYTIQRTLYGVVLRNGDDDVTIFTSWPLDEPYQQSEQTAERIRTAGGSRLPTQEGAVNAGEPVPFTGAIIEGAQTHGYGDLGITPNPST